MPQTLSFVPGDSRHSRSQGRCVVEEVRGRGCPGAVAINTPGIPQKSLRGVYGAVFSSINHVEMRIPPAQHHLRILGSQQLMEELSPGESVGKRRSHGVLRKDTQKPSEPLPGKLLLEHHRAGSKSKPAAHLHSSPVHFWPSR